eukprot:m.49534 g.49534  ORF g.49534 m.49534 type:complete len:252 (+) comp7456_c0_seq1:242-997(+)
MAKKKQHKKKSGSGHPTTVPLASSTISAPTSTQTSTSTSPSTATATENTQQRYQQQQSDFSDPLRFATKPLPRLDVCDPKVLEHFLSESPVIITNSHLVDSAFQWDLKYLEENMGQATFRVMSSASQEFAYFDSDKNFGNYEFESQCLETDMKFPDFARCVRQEMRKGRNEKKSFLFLQQPLNDSVGEAIVQDFVKFNWQWLTAFVKTLPWGNLTTNMLHVGRSEFCSFIQNTIVTYIPLDLDILVTASLK